MALLSKSIFLRGKPIYFTPTMLIKIL